MSRDQRVGRVAAFDEQVGLGTVAGDDGTTYSFHCTQIADGSRTIPVGEPVEFAVTAAHGGRWEAVGVRRLASARPG